MEANNSSVQTSQHFKSVKESVQAGGHDLFVQNSEEKAIEEPILVEDVSEIILAPKEKVIQNRKKQSSSFNATSGKTQLSVSKKNSENKESNRKEATSILKQASKSSFKQNTSVSGRLSKYSIISETQKYQQQQDGSSFDVQLEKHENSLERSSRLQKSAFATIPRRSTKQRHQKVSVQTEVIEFEQLPVTTTDNFVYESVTSTQIAEKLALDEQHMFSEQQFKSNVREDLIENETD